MTFARLVTTFFNNYLRAERGLRANTIASYSDCMKLLIRFACERHGIQPEKLDVGLLDRDLVIDFLDHLEGARGNMVSTRNQRLSAIKTFFHFLASNVPELMHLSQTIQAIREKNTDCQPPPSLTRDEAAAILSQPELDTTLGARDNALLQLLYNTGARVQELADLSVGDVRFGASPLVTLTGKGGKTRVIPLWKKTAEAITRHLETRRRDGVESEHLFLNARGYPLTRFGIGRRIEKHAGKAQLDCPSLCGRRITPHVFRHTVALHLIEAGNDIANVQRWLGHADMRTTSGYFEVSVERKRKALEKLPPPDCGQPPEQPQWKQPAMMAFLAKLSRAVMVRGNG